MSKCKLENCKCKTSDSWLINSPENGNCFWMYISANKRNHTLKETADLLGLTISVVTSTEKKVIEKLGKHLKDILSK